MSSGGNSDPPPASTTNTTTTSNSLRPFDLSGLGMGFGIYRPRRPSYTFATQENRSRNESYRCATRKEHLDSNISDPPSPSDEDSTSHRRKTSYIKATKNSNRLPSSSSNDKKKQRKESRKKKNNIAETTLNAELEAIRIINEHTIKNENRLTPDNDLTTSDRDDNGLDLDNLRCNSNRNSLSRSSRNNKFDAVRDNNSSHEDISLTEVTLIQTVPIRSEANGNLNPNQTPKTTANTSSATNHNNRRSLSTSVGSVRRMVSSTLRFNKNLIVLSISFILIYSSFQAIQNLQSSINAAQNLGPITMMIVHIATVFSCLIAPSIINILSAKWALCVGVLFFLAWFGANFQPTFYGLVPASCLIGLAQGVVWSAESSYIHKLAFDWSKISRASVDDEVFRFHGIFLACFQTTHIWGNLISSLWFSQRRKDIVEEMATKSSAFGPAMFPAMVDSALPFNASMEGGVAFNEGDMGQGGMAMEGETYLDLSKCGALSQCEGPTPRIYPKLISEDPLSGVLWKLMLFYIIFGVIALLLVVFLLDRIGARASPGLTPKQVIIQHTSQLVTHPTLRLLIPLLLFNGIQQGFMYLDYNKYFVTCSLGVHYIGYCMITLGVANVLGAVFVTLFAHRIPREVILGFGGILHIALMIGYLIWIPEDKPVLFCILAGAWGLCDAIWQTQCNTLICLTCVEEPEVAFTNYRLVHSVGLAVVFGMSTWACVSVKLYLLMVLLVVAIMFYVLAEYQLRHSDDDDVFEP